MIGDITDKTVSNFQPSTAVRELTMKVRQDYQTGYDIMNRPFREFNDKSMLTRMDLDQKAFNSYVDPASTDPDESWRYNGVRPLTRNKIISIAAHVTAQLMYPKVFAQNNQDKEDKAAAQVMRDMIEWNIRNSDYELSFLYGVISALTNPAVIVQADFAEVMESIKVRGEDGSIRMEEVVDDILSGFHMHVVPLDELFITNPYEFHIQRQKAIIRRRFIDYTEANAIYGGHENWVYVQPGVRALLNEDDGTFYDQKDDELNNLVEEAIYYNRQEDVEIPFVNGIYHGDDNVDHNMMKHRDTLNRPKYPFAKSGYEPIDEKRFFYYKSAVFKLANEQDVLDRMWRMAMDGTFLDTMPPVIISGDDIIDTGVVFPGAVTSVSKDTKANPLRVANPNSAFNAISSIEQAAAESSQDNSRQGISSAGAQTAFETAKIEQNARIQLGLFGKMIGALVKDFGHLMIDDIIHHQTVGQAEELMSGDVAMKFRSFLLPEQTIDGKSVTKSIVFTDEFMGRNTTLSDSFKQLEEEGGIDSDVRIYKVNPFLFSRLKFMLSVDADVLLPKNEAFEKAMNLEAYDRMIVDPFTNKKAVSQDFLIETFAKGDSDRYMMSSEKLLGMGINESGQPSTPSGGGNTSELVNQATGSNSVKSLVTQ
jgi:hypothetical protein